jgi:hypothetical protein
MSVGVKWIGVRPINKGGTTGDGALVPSRDGSVFVWNSFEEEVVAMKQSAGVERDGIAPAVLAMTINLEAQ